MKDKDLNKYHIILVHMVFLDYFILQNPVRI